jgi:hypothetical protein
VSCCAACMVSCDREVLPSGVLHACMVSRGREGLIGHALSCCTPISCGFDGPVVWQVWLALHRCRLFVRVFSVLLQAPTAVRLCLSPGVAAALLPCCAVRVQGSPLQRYAEYAVAIRQEYSHLNDADYCVGRCAMHKQTSVSAVLLLACTLCVHTHTKCMLEGADRLRSSVPRF